MAKKPIIRFKRGDDFKLDLTVTDTNNSTAIAAKIVMDAAQITYDEALAADPQVQLDIDDALAALTAAQSAYNAAIIVDITDWTITSQLAWCGKVIDTFTVTKTDALGGTFSLSKASTETIEWVPRVYDTDIQFVRPQGKVSSQTYSIEVLKDITHV